MSIEHDSKLDGIQRQIANTEKLLRKSVETTELEKLRELIRKPGWTTPAELLFTTFALENLQNQIQTVIKLKKELLEVSELVGIEIHA